MDITLANIKLVVNDYYDPNRKLEKSKRSYWESVLLHIYPSYPSDYHPYGLGDLVSEWNTVWCDMIWRAINIFGHHYPADSGEVSWQLGHREINGSITYPLSSDPKINDRFIKILFFKTDDTCTDNFHLDQARQQRLKSIFEARQNEHLNVIQDLYQKKLISSEGYSCLIGEIPSLQQLALRSVTTESLQQEIPIPPYVHEQLTHRDTFERFDSFEIFSKKTK